MNADVVPLRHKTFVLRRVGMIETEQEQQDLGGMTLAALRVLVKGMGRGGVYITLHQRDGGYAMHYAMLRHSGGWLIAEHSKQVRIFRKVETALSVARQLGVKKLEVAL